MLHSIETIDQIFQSYNIHNYQDYKRFCMQAHWIHDTDSRYKEIIKTILHSAYNYLASFHVQQNSQYICFVPCNIDSFYYSELNEHLFSLHSNHQSEDISKYMCLFPKRSLIMTGELINYSYPYNRRVSLVRINQDELPDDFFKQYFKFHNLLSHDIARLYPITQNYYNNPDDDLDPNIRDLFDILKMDDEINGKRPSRTPHYFTERALEEKNNISLVYPHHDDFTPIIHNPHSMYIAFPWLYNANIDSFIDITEKYPHEFDHFTRAIEELSLISRGAIDFQTKVSKDLKDALGNIQIAYEKEQAILKRKGILTIVGLVLTVLPITNINIIKDIIDPSLMKTFIGGTSVCESLSLANDFMSLKKVGVENPYWVIWKWCFLQDRNAESCRAVM